MGKAIVSVCLSVRTRRGATSSPFHNTSAGPMSFPGDYSSDWSQVPSRGYPSQVPWPGQDEGYPKMRYLQQGWGTPFPRRDGYPGQEWGTPSQRWVSLSQGWGTPCQGWGTPCQGWGTIGQQREYLVCGAQYASCFHAGRTFLFQN